MFTVDSFVCGIAPLGTNLVLLTFDKPKEQGNMKASTCWCWCSLCSNEKKTKSRYL